MICGVFVGVLALCGVMYVWLRPESVAEPRPSPHPPARPVRVRASARSGALPPSRLPPEVVTEAVRHVCGLEPSTADRYERRNVALRSVARIRDLPPGDVVALSEYVVSTGGSLRVEREAALRNDVLNLLTHQEPIPEGLTDLLIAMVESVCSFPTPHEMGSKRGLSPSGPGLWQNNAGLVSACSAW